MTLIELIVSMAILVIIITLTGYTFSEVSKATEQVESCLRSNAAVLALEGQLRRDLAAAAPEGLLVIGGDPSVPNSPSMLLITVTGRYVSQTGATGGVPVTADAAVIVYALAAPVAAAPQQGSVLCRYVYLLTGSGSSPRNLAEAAAWGAADFNPMARTDVLGNSLQDVRAQNVTNAGTNYCVPATVGRRINLAPRQADDPAAGGVRQLWPVMFAGCQSITWSYCDGLQANGLAPSVGAAEWFTVASPGSRNRSCPRLPPQPLFQRFLGNPFTVWDRTMSDLRPRALRTTVTLCGPTVGSPGQTYEIVVDLRK